jgi:hypothetical protein
MDLPEIHPCALAQEASPRAPIPLHARAPPLLRLATGGRAESVLIRPAAQFPPIESMLRHTRNSSALMLETGGGSGSEPIGTAENNTASPNKSLKRGVGFRLASRGPLQPP